MVVEELIWSFCLAFGRTPPVGCCWIAIERFMLALVTVAVVVPRSGAKSPETLPWDGDLNGTAAVADDLCADLHGSPARMCLNGCHDLFREVETPAPSVGAFSLPVSDDASETDMARGRIDWLRMARGRTVAAAVVRRT
jgi:hypothetical protein